MLKAFSIMVNYVSRKFPVYASKNGTRFHHSFTFDFIENLTPSELNAPDKMPPSRNFYQVQNGLDKLMAVFLFKVSIVQTKVGQAYQNPYAQQSTEEDEDQEETPKRQTLERLYLLSFPKVPFQRKSSSSFSHMINIGLKAANVESQQTEVSFAELKAQFPTNKMKIRSIKSADKLKQILSGKSVSEEEEDSEE